MAAAASCATDRMSRRPYITVLSDIAANCLKLAQEKVPELPDRRAN
jgi:hypothetical protein